jgi:hypothetical protein
MQIAHEEARSLIRLRSDSTLSLNKQESLDAHLHGCLDCVTYANEIKETEDVLRSTMQKHWTSPAPPMAQINALMEYKSSKKGTGAILSIRTIAVYTSLVVLGLITWRFISAPGYPTGLMVAEASPIPTPSLTYTLTQDNVGNCSQIKYRVREHDTFESIARQFSTSKEELMELNNLQSSSVTPQMEILVPLCELTPAGTTYPPTFTTTPQLKLTAYTPE